MVDFKDVTEIYNSLSFTDKSIKLLHNLSENKEKSLELVEYNNEIFNNLITTLANSNDKNKHKLVLKFLKIPKFLHHFVLNDYFNKRSEGNYPSIFNTKSDKIHNYILSNLDITKHSNQHINYIVEMLPERYINEPQIKEQAYAFDKKKCLSARKRLGVPEKHHF